MGERGSYDAGQYDRPAVTVDTVILSLRHDQLHVLLVQRKHWPYEGMWAIPGGFVDTDESLEAAARRELAEETGVAGADVYLEQLHAFGDPGRDPRTRVITVAYTALISSERLTVHADTDAAAADWFPADQPPPLAFDHAQILSYALRRLRFRIEHTAVAFPLLPETFTLCELQQVYERILAEKPEGPVFQRQVLSAGIVEPAPQARGGDREPVRLYRFREDAVSEIRSGRFLP